MTAPETKSRLEVRDMLQRPSETMISCCRSIALAAVSGAFFAASALPVLAQNLGGLERALESAGYRLYVPPRTNWGPGFVFSGTVSNGRISDVEEICPNLYADQKAPQSAKVVLANYRTGDAYSIELALGWLKSLFVKQPLEASATLNGGRNVDVDIRDISERSYSRMDQWLATGEPRPINRRCRLAIEDLKKKGRFDGRVFVIVRAIAPKSLTYDFNGNMSAAAAASASLPKTVDATLKGSASKSDATRLEINGTVYVGYAPPALISEWLPSGLVSGEIVEVKAKPTNLGIDQ